MVCLTFNGDVFTCGEKEFIGHGELESDLNLPKKLTNIGKVGYISCGWQHTILVSTDGNTLWSFGSTGGCPLTLQIGVKKSVRLKENFL